MRTRQVVIVDRGRVEIVDGVVESPGPQELLLEAECSLISSGSELAGLRGLTPSSQQAAGRARATGYSFVGVVRQVGEGVTKWRVGQRVAGRAPHASWTVVPADQPHQRSLVPVPDDVPPEYATFVTLMSVALNGIRLAKVDIGEPVAVLGQGLVGQLSAQFARIAGARPIVAIDSLSSRLEIARRGGATDTINVHSVDDLAARVREVCGGVGPRVVIEATGHPQPVTTALKIAAHGARVVLVGSTRGVVSEWDPYTDVHRKALTIIGAHSPSSHPPVGTFWNPWTRPENMRVALDLIADGSLRIEPLITHRFPAEEASAAYAGLLATPEEHLGVVLDWRTGQLKSP